MLDKLSRYKSLQSSYTTDKRGRTVIVTPSAPDPKEESMGTHLRKQGQRIDHLAYRYLNNGAGYWRICELNDVMLPEALTEARDIAIPKK